jgi:hypothetical protein
VLVKDIIIYYDLNTGFMTGNHHYSDAIRTAFHIPVQRRQILLDAATERDSSVFAIDYYGIYTMNCYLHPVRMKIFFAKGYENQLYQHLAQYPLEQFEQSFGPVRYIQIISQLG